jgi:hypothetical protein
MAAGLATAAAERSGAARMEATGPVRGIRVADASGAVQAATATGPAEAEAPGLPVEGAMPPAEAEAETAGQPPHPVPAAAQTAPRRP